MKDTMNLAVLIDADNVSYVNIKGILEEITKDGVPTIKRIYGDWTKPAMKGWKEVLLEHSITPMQQYAYTTGKNSTDSALIIDAMDMLHKENVDGFCIVSSDSDFTRLASRLRESGKLVIGIGEQKTPKPFIASCNRFIYIEILMHALAEDAEPAADGTEPADETAAGAKPTKKRKQAVTKISSPSKKDSLVKIDKQLLSLLTATINDLSDDEGWAFLGEVGNNINRKQPDFDSRNYGFKKLSSLIKSMSDRFEVEERAADGRKTKQVCVRIKPIVKPRQAR